MTSTLSIHGGEVRLHQKEKKHEPVSISDSLFLNDCL